MEINSNDKRHNQGIKLVLKILLHIVTWLLWLLGCYIIVHAAIMQAKVTQSFSVRKQLHIGCQRLDFYHKSYYTNCKNMPTYKLTYFNVTGLGEPIRYLLSQCGIKFEDVRLTFEDWPKYKSNMPMGQVPVLEIDGKPYHQSKAISRFLAKKSNLYGSDEFEAMEIDAAVDSIDDLRQALSTYYWEQDTAFKAKLKETAFQKLPFYLDKFEAQVKKNGGYFVGGKLSWADLLWTAYTDYLNSIVNDLNKDHPELKKLVEKVRALPNIKAYIEKRPKTQL
ncbi:hypothetical protein P5V15_001748 [Pogonomyrmex californicus]